MKVVTIILLCAILNGSLFAAEIDPDVEQKALAAVSVSGGDAHSLLPAERFVEAISKVDKFATVSALWRKYSNTKDSIKMRALLLDFLEHDGKGRITQYPVLE